MTHLTRNGWLAALCVLLCAAHTGCAGSDGEATEEAARLVDAVTTAVPVQRVVLYRSGIAYVERRGQIDDEVLRLQIRADQINDILTTLTVLVDGGRNVASSIGLPIERTVAQDLDSLPPQVRQQGGMVALLNAFRGAMVRVEAVNGTVEGQVIGTENLTNDEGNLIRRVTVMTHDGTLRQIRVDQIREVALENDTLSVGLARSLDVSLGEGDWKPVELTLSLSGQPPHDVFVSYVVEMPTWKPTYRIIVDDGELHLQGWAVVDNVSGESWDDVALSLVAGTPISFEYDLHSPRFVSRPDLTARGFEGQTALMAPPVQAGVALGAVPATEREVGSRDRRARSGAREEQRSDDAPWEAPAAADPWGGDDDAGGAGGIDALMLVDSMSSSAGAEALDNLFRYDVGYDISIADRGSALVTIINEPIEGEDVLYFDPATPQAGGRPYRAIRLVNSTDFTIERGPLTIFKDSTFVGQAIGPRIGEDELVFLPYSVDGRFRITERQSTGDEGVRLVRIANSVIYSEVQNVRRRTFQVMNNSGDEARLYVSVPKRTNWFLRTPDPEAGEVIDQGAVWFVPLSLDGAESTELVIEEATLVTRSVQIWSDIAAETIAFYISSDEAVPEVAEVLQTILEQRERIAEVERELNSHRQRRNDVYRRMDEIRQNLEALGETRQSRELRRTLERRLSEQEEHATELTVTIVAFEEEEAELRALISTALMDLTLDGGAGD